MNRLQALLLAACLALSGPAQAQIGLPQLPTVPGVGEVTGQLPDVGDTATNATGRALQQVRELRVRELLRENRRALEADPAGEPIVRSQILALGMNGEAIAAAEARGFQVVQTDGLGDAGAMTTLRAPRGMSTRRALRALRQADPNGVYDFDHLHLESGAALAVPMFAQSSAVRGGPRVGLIDSGVGEASGLAAQRAFAGQAVAGPHGRMVASLINSAAPGARIYAADIYGGVPTGGASSALARALTWLAEEQTPVINVSLVGPRNQIIETLVARLVARGFIVVAAVGNDGPAASPLFPASYPGVVGVTALTPTAACSLKRVAVRKSISPRSACMATGARGCAELPTPHRLWRGFLRSTCQRQAQRMLSGRSPHCVHRRATLAHAGATTFTATGSLTLLRTPLRRAKLFSPTCGRNPSSRSFPHQPGQIAGQV